MNEPCGGEIPVDPNVPLEPEGADKYTIVDDEIGEKV
jgi:hypothetical protein